MNMYLEHPPPHHHPLLNLTASSAGSTWLTLVATPPLKIKKANVSALAYLSYHIKHDKGASYYVYRLVLLYCSKACYSSSYIHMYIWN